MPVLVGVDIGGTFADFVALDPGDGRMATLKVLTTPDNPGQDVAAGGGAVSEPLAAIGSEVEGHWISTTGHGRRAARGRGACCCPADRRPE